MAIVYVIGIQEHVEELIQISRVLHRADYQAKFPQAQTRIAENYTDRITKTVADTVIPLSVNKNDHNDRIDDYTEHDDPDTDLCYVSYDDTKTAVLDLGYYYNPIARITNGAHPNLINNTKAQAEAKGFVIE